MKIGKVSLGLRSRIVLVVLLAAVVRVAVTVDYLQEQRDRDVAEARGNLAVQARKAGDDLATRIDAAHQLLFGLSQVRELDTPDSAACSARLAAVLKRYPQYTGILTILPDGTLHCDSLQTGRRLQLADRAYFQQAMASDGLALEPVFGRLTSLGVMQAALASRDGAGKVRFVLLVSINLDRFARDVVATQPYPDTGFTIHDKSGTVLAARTSGVPRGSKPLTGRSLVGDELGRFAFAASAGDTAVFAGPSGVRRVWAAGALPGPGTTGLKLVLGVPEEQLMAGSGARARSILWSMLGATLFTVLIALVLAEFVVLRPLARIMAATSRFRRGDLDARIGLPYPANEIGELMRSLDRTSQEAQSRQEEFSRFNSLLEDRVHQRTAELESVNEELKAFSYAVAHDLRQPLISMNGHAELLQKSLKDAAAPATLHYLGRMRASVQQISELADAMVALAHLSRASLVFQEVDLSAMVEAALKACRDREPGRSVHATVQPGLKAMADSALLRQAVGSLIDNAWKFSAGAKDARISFGALPEEDGITVYFVKDNGAGFDMAYAGKLFTAFHRMHSPAEFSGTGMGLAYANKIITRHGGLLRAESVPGAGATFYFTLGKRRD